MMGRILSAMIAVAYLVTAYAADGGEAAFRVGLFLLLPMACIWFGEAMGNYAGGTMRGHYVSSTTPGCLVVAGGWLLLLLPAVVGLIGYIRSPG